MRIGVAGIAGRMGRLVAEEILHAGATLTGGLGLPHDTAPPGVPLFTTLPPLAAISDAIIDFTRACAAHAEAAPAEKNHQGRTDQESRHRARLRRPPATTAKGLAIPMHVMAS